MNIDNSGQLHSLQVDYHKTSEKLDVHERRRLLATTTKRNIVRVAARRWRFEQCDSCNSDQIDRELRLLAAVASERASGTRRCARARLVTSRADGGHDCEDDGEGDDDDDERMSACGAPSLTRSLVAIAARTAARTAARLVR